MVPLLRQLLVRDELLGLENRSRTQAPRAWPVARRPTACAGADGAGAGCPGSCGTDPGVYGTRGHVLDVAAHAAPEQELVVGPIVTNSLDDALRLLRLLEPPSACILRPPAIAQPYRSRPRRIAVGGGAGAG